MAVKLSYHYSERNLFAQPGNDEFLELLDQGRLDDHTGLVSFGVQFSF